MSFIQWAKNFLGWINSTPQTSLTGRKLTHWSATNINPEWADFLPPRWNSDYTPNFDSWLKKVDTQATIDNLIDKAIAIARYEEVRQGWDKNYSLPQEDVDTFNKYIKTLKDLWVSKNAVSAEYYRRYPTKEMEAWDKAWQAMNNWVYKTFWTVDWNARYWWAIEDAATDKAASNADIKKTIAKWLSSLVKKWKITDNVSKIQKLIDLYNKVK